MEQVAPQVLGKAGGGFCTGKAGKTAADQRDGCHYNKKKSHFHNAFDGSACLNPVDQIGGDKGDNRLDDSFAYNENERKNGRSFVFSYASGKLF